MITDPEYDPEADADPPEVTGPNPLSVAIGGADGFPVIPITLNGDPYVPDALFDEGLQVLAEDTLGTGPETSALSIADFNVFRTEMVNIVRILDGKIREMLAVAAPQCP